MPIAKMTSAKKKIANPPLSDLSMLVLHGASLFFVVSLASVLDCVVLSVLWTAIPESKIPHLLFSATKMNEPPPLPKKRVHTCPIAAQKKRMPKAKKQK